MSKSATVSDRLARAYREARVLVLGDRTPEVDRALALHRDFLALRASITRLQEGEISEWETTFLERTRRAIIVALRYQAMAVRDRWSESRGALDPDQDVSPFDLDHAQQLVTAAMQLHLDGDPDAPRTAKVIEYVRQSYAQAAGDAADTAAEPPAQGGEPQPAPESAASSLHAKDIESEPDMTRALRAPRWLPALIASGFIVLVGAASLVLRVVTAPVTDSARSPRHPAGVVTGASPPVRRAEQPRVTVVLFQSEPAGARVTVDGQFRGTTPLNLEGKPGDVLTIVVQKDTRTWRGVLTVGSEGKQAVTIRLRPPRVAETPRPQPSISGSTAPTRFDTVMRDGIDLYKKGWFGPAVGRFREAVGLDPKSSDASLWLARALIRSDRHAEAKRMLERVIELTKTGPQAEEAAVLLSKL